uniref:Uncharacterized protein LOC111131681 n=1 Tax=Crassostrea virginica TaxID=6565 RepID=A0A8B8E6H9_CRAVI|nr:uncharacterized protein LOC111131681 [Crassostrea virginica]
MAVGSQELQGLCLNQDADAESMYQQGNGPYNIFILDTSSRLGEDGFQEMKEIFASMIDEYAKHPEVDENVAVFVCGRQTKFHHYFSNQYEDIKQSIENLEYGGPCPLEAAILLVSRNLRKDTSRSCVINGYHVHPRVILLTNGRPTPSTIKDEDYFPELYDHKVYHRKNVSST